MIRWRDGGLGPYEAAGKGDPERTISLMVTDYTIREPDRLLARAHTTNGQPSIAITSRMSRPAAIGFGLSHGGEIGYVFGRGRRIRKTRR